MRSFNRSQDMPDGPISKSFDSKFGTNQKYKRNKLADLKAFRTEARRDSSRTLSTTFHTTKDRFMSVQPLPVQATQKDYKKQNNRAPMVSKPFALLAELPVIRHSSVSVNRPTGLGNNPSNKSNSKIEQEGETNNEKPIGPMSSQRRLLRLKKMLSSRDTGFSRNLRRKLHSIVDMEVLKNRKIFSVEPQAPATNDQFKFYKFVKQDVQLSNFCKPMTVAVNDCLLTEAELSQLMNHMVKGARRLRHIILDRALDQNKIQFLWDNLVKVRMPELRTLSIASGDVLTSKLILKYLQYAFGELAGTMSKVSFHFQDFNNRSLVDLVNWENFLFKTHLLEVMQLELTNSFLFQRLVDESSHKLTSLRWFTVRSAQIKVRRICQNILDLKGLQVLHFDQVI